MPNGAFGPDFLRNLTPATRGLLLANLAVFLVQWILELAGLRSWEVYAALVPELVLQKYFLWQIITFNFMHNGVFHILFNMLILVQMGPAVETLWGSRRFLVFYLVCGAGAGFLGTIFNGVFLPFLGSLTGSAALAEMGLVPVIGASGAIFGLLYAFARFYPQAMMLLFFVFPVSARTMVLVLGVISFMLAFSAGGGTIAHSVHLGGLVVAFLYFRLQDPVIRFWQQHQERKQAWQAGKAKPDLALDIDPILAKISRQGIGSLSEMELYALKKYSERKRKSNR
jgi:membrane associated rhomboid family serine protease